MDGPPSGSTDGLLVSGLPASGGAASCASGAGGGGLGAGQVGAGLGRVGGQGPQGEPTMTDLMREMQNMRLSLDTKFNSMQRQLEDLKSEMSTLKAEMVTKEVFKSLEVRVTSLEAEGAPSLEVTWLHSQVGRLDPANKSLCFKDFPDDDLRVRTSRINQILESLGAKAQILNGDHIWKGSPGQRVVSGMSIVELSSRQARGEALKALTNDSSKLGNGSGTVQVGQAKGFNIIKSNDCLTKAADVLKK